MRLRERAQFRVLRRLGLRRVVEPERKLRDRTVACGDALRERRALFGRGGHATLERRARLRAGEVHREDAEHDERRAHEENGFHGVPRCCERIAAWRERLRSMGIL